MLSVDKDRIRIGGIEYKYLAVTNIEISRRMQECRISGCFLSMVPSGIVDVLIEWVDANHVHHKHEGTWIDDEVHIEEGVIGND